MMKINLFKQTAIFSFVGSVLFTPLASQALIVEEVINPRQANCGWVTDMADILSERTETELNQLITELEQANGIEMAIVTVPETTPSKSPKAFATQLFNYWGIGTRTDNGILFLVSYGDSRVEIVTGYGIQEILPEAKVGHIIDTQITPQYKHGNFDRGTLDGTNALSELTLTSDRRASSPVVKTSSGAVLVFLLLCLVFIIIAASDNSKNKGRKKSSSNSIDSYGGYDGGDCGGGYSDGGSSGCDFGGGDSGGSGSGGDF